MDGLTTTKGLTRRGGLAAFAIAMFLSLAAISTPAQAQETRFPFNAFGGFQGGVSVGAAAGQTIRIVIRTTSDISLNKPSEEPGVIIIAGSGASGHVKSFNAKTGALLWSREFTSLTAGLHTFDINRDELPEASISDTGRVQLWIEVVIAGRTGVNVFSPTFEVFENESGRTTVRGGIWKTTNFLTTDPLRSRPIVFTGLE